LDLANAFRAVRWAPLDDGKMVFQTDIVNTMIQVSIKRGEHEAALYQVLSCGDEKQRGCEILWQGIFVGIEKLKHTK
jgi:hypothetical protein